MFRDHERGHLEFIEDLNNKFNQKSFARNIKWKRKIITYIINNYICKVIQFLLGVKFEMFI